MKAEKATFYSNTEKTPTEPSKTVKINPSTSRLRRKFLKHTTFLRILILLTLSLILGFVFWGGTKSLPAENMRNIAGWVKIFILTPPGSVKEISRQTNVLILGKGGEGHETPDLTDTIILANISHEKPKTTLLSLPRDIWIEGLRTKLNSVYYWGNKEEPGPPGFGGGIKLAKSVVEEITGQPVQYAVVVDFSGFVKIIDILEGIEVAVENSFTDNKYPIAGKEKDLCDGDPEYKCRYENLHFVQGKQMMDGETALKFVRSRNADGSEGTDLARAKRQQKVIEGIKNKILSREVLFNPKKLFELKEIILNSIESDIDTDASLVIFRRLINRNMNINSYVLGEEFLINPPRSGEYDNLYVFVPKEKDWTAIHDWIDNILKD